MDADALFSQFEAETGATPRAVAGTGGDPNLAGKSLSLEKKGFAPAPVVEQDYENFYKDYLAKQAGDAVRKNPKIGQYVQSHPMAATVSNDDYDNLDRLSSSLTRFGPEFAFGEILASPEGRQRVIDFIKSVPTHFMDGVIGAARTTGEAFLQDQAARQTISKRIGEAVVEGGQAGYGMAPYETAEEIEKLRRLGVFRSPGAALGLTSGIQFINEAIGRPLIGGIEAAFRAGGAAIMGAGAGVGEAAAIATGGNEAEAARARRDFAQLGLIATMLFGGTPIKEPIAMAGENLAARTRAALTPEERPVAKPVPAGAGVTPEGEQFLTPKAPTVTDVKIEQQKLDAANMDKIMEDAEVSQTKKRSPEMLSRFAALHNQNDVFISPDAIMALYKSKGRTIDTDDKLFGYIPDLKEQLVRGFTDGRDIRIPLADYIANTSRETHRAIRDDLRLRFDGLTGAETITLKDPKPEKPAVPINKSAVAEELARQRAELYLAPMFKDAKSLGITEAEFKKYSARIEAAHADVLEKVQAAEERIAKRQQTAEWKREEARTREEVESDFRSRPDLVADTFFREGRLPTGEKVPEFTKLDKAAVEAIVGKDHHLGKIVEAQGAMPDLAAHMLDYESGAKLVQDLELIHRARVDLKESPKAYYDRIVAQEVEARMFEQFGDLKANIEAAAREIVLAKTHFDVLAEELRMLAEQAGGSMPFSREAMASWVETTFGEGKVKDVRDWELLAKAIEREGRNAEKALLSGKFEDAFKAKQRQTMAFLGLREAQAFRKEADRAGRLWRQYAENDVIKGVSQDYANQIQAILRNLGIKISRDPRSLEQSLRGVPLHDFIQSKLDVGTEIAETTVPRVASIREMTVNEFRDVATMLQSLDHNARREGYIILRDKREAFEAAVGEAVTNLDNLADKRRLGPTHESGRIRRVVREIDARLLKWEQLLDWIDRNDPHGVMNRTVYRGLIEGEHAKHDMLTKLAEDALKIPSTREWGRRLDELTDNRVLRDENGGIVPLTNENKIVIALNTGNKENFKVLSNGHGWRVDEIKQFLRETMTDDDWKFVQGVWRLFDRIAPELERMTERVSGVPIPLIEAEHVETSLGLVKGGYYPLVENQRNILLKQKRMTDLFERNVWAPLPTARAMRRRTGAVYPLDLTLTNLHNRIAETVHAIYFREPVTNAQKMLYDPLIRDGIARAFGDEYVAQIEPWLRDIATNGGLMQDHGMAAASRMVRENVITALIGLRLSTAAIHGLSAATTSAYEVGVGSMLKQVTGLGLKQYLPGTIRRFVTNPQSANSMLDFAYATSSELRNRQRTMNRDIHHQMQKLVSKGVMDDAARLRTVYQNLALSMVGYTDQLSSTWVWTAAYEKAMRTMSHEDAVYVADKAIRQAHGSASLVNRANITRGHELQRWFTMFYGGYWNHNYNRFRDAVRTMRDTDLDLSERALQGAAAVTALIFLPAIWHELIRGHDTDTPSKAIASGLTAQFAGQVPVAGSVLNAFTAGRKDPSVTPLETFARTFSDAAFDLLAAANGDKTSQFVKHMALVPTYAIGIGPTVQMASALQFLTDIVRDKQRPVGVIEWMRGLNTGKAQPPRRHH